jgi:hypothetical protein
MLDKAREKGDVKTQLAVHKLLEQRDRTTITLAATIGTFNGFAPGAPSDHDDRNAVSGSCRRASKRWSRYSLRTPTTQ